MLKNWLKKILSNRNNENQRSLQHQRVQSKHKKWQRKIRSLLNLNPETTDSIDCDFDILFEIWKIPKQELISVFGKINGIEELFNQIFEYINSKPQTKLDIEDYKKHVTKNTQLSIQRISQYVDVSEFNKLPMNFEKNDFHEDYKKSKNLFSLTGDIDDEIYDLILEKGGEEKYILALFLVEPLYRISTLYLPVYFFIWKLIEDKNNLNPYEYLFELLKKYNTRVLIYESKLKVYNDFK